MSARLFDTYVMVDWSAASRPTTGRDSIWIGLARRGAPTTVENIATRAEAVRRLGDLLADEYETGRRVLAGFDFPFGYPAGVARHLTGRDEALALWGWLAERIEDGPDNANNRYAVAGEVNRRYDGLGPFWGHPHQWTVDDVPMRGRARSGLGHPPERRLADRAAKGAKTVWQLAGAGSVGSQVLVGLPALDRLRRDPRIAGATRVWPFETGLTAPEAQIVLAEIYPSLIPPDPAEAIRDAGQVRAVADWLARLDDNGDLRAAFDGPTDASDGERQVIAREEAWILGLEAAALPAPRKAAAAPRPLRYERDPAAIYAQSFATVRAEARLDHLPEALHDVAIRLVHACGMPDLTARLAWSADAADAAREALAGGAPILCDCEAVAAMIVQSRLPAANPVLCMLNAPVVRTRAAEIGNTRSAAAVELWREQIEGAVVAIGNAPTALFHLLELIDAGWPRPAAVLAFPVGFVGAAESKAELAARPRGMSYITLRGRRGGSALAAAAVNALAAGLTTPA